VNGLYNTNTSMPTPCEPSAFPLRRLIEKVSPECLTGGAGDCAVHGPERFRANCAFGGSTTTLQVSAALSHDNLKACERIHANGEKIHSGKPARHFLHQRLPGNGGRVALLFAVCLLAGDSDFYRTLSWQYELLHIIVSTK